MISHLGDFFLFVLLNLAGGIMVIAESPLEGNSGGQWQIQTLRIFHLLVVALLEVIKEPGKEHDPAPFC